MTGEVLPQVDSLTGEVQNEEGNENTIPVPTGSYGDILGTIKEEDCLLFGFINVNGLRKEKWKEKNATIMNTLRRYKFDAVGLAEPNLHWPSLPHGDRWEDRILGQWESVHNSISFNSNEPVNSPCQPGGCQKIQSTINNFDTYWNIQTIDLPLRLC